MAFKEQQFHSDIYDFNFLKRTNPPYTNFSLYLDYKESDGDEIVYKYGDLLKKWALSTEWADKEFPFFSGISSQNKNIVQYLVLD